MNTTPRILVYALLVILCLTLWAAPSALLAEEQDEPAVKAKVTLRYRFETVDDAAFAKDAEASTLRTTLAVTTRSHKGFRLFAEAENVTAVGDDSYNNRGAGSLANGVTDRPVVADPAITELNQAYIEFAGEKTTGRLGRQEVTVGDHRFVGHVGWRQNHQSFDALTVSHKTGGRLSLLYAYLDSVHRIFGDSVDMGSHVVKADVEAGGGAKLGLYGVLLDYDRLDTLSTDTWGLELAGKRKAGDNRSLLYELEYATQSESGDNPLTIDADYLFGMVGIAGPRVTAKVGWEQLDGQFSTPLATLHKFNGWADKFLRTPTNGLEDLYLAVNGKAGKVAWLAVFHQFSATMGSADYGEEIDLQLTYKTSWDQVIALKAALYDADTFGTDTDKWMLWTSYSIP